MSTSPTALLASGLRQIADALEAMDTKPEPEGGPLSAKAAGAALGLSADRIYRLVRSGELRAIRVGKSVRIPADELESFRRRRTR